MVVHRISDGWQGAFLTVTAIPLAISNSSEMAVFAHAGLRGAWQRDPGNTRAFPQPRALIHAITHMQDELRCSAGNPFAMWNVIERPSQLMMFGNVAPDLVQTFSGRLQTLLEFRFCFDLRFAECHLHAAVSVHFAFPGSFNWQEDHVLELVDHRRLHSVRL